MSGLLGLARASQASLFMVLQAGLAALLTRLGAGTDIPIGSPIAGRTDSALDDLVGFFVNTLVLRTDTAGNPSFRELIGRVRAADLAAYDHQDLPFERLVEVLNPARSLARHPLFQVMLAFEHDADVRLDAPGLAAALQPVATGTARFDLVFSVSEQRGRDGASAGISGILQYATDSSIAPSAETLVRRLVRLLEGAVADPGQAIGRPRYPRAGGAPHHSPRMERHGAAGAARNPAGHVRGTGGARARSPGGGARAAKSHLRATGCTRQPGGASPARPRRRARSWWSASASSVRSR